MEAMRLLIAGTPFSGATLLGHMLGAHPRVFFAGRPALEGRSSGADCPTCGAGATACPAWDAPGVRAAAGDGAARADALAAALDVDVVAEGPLDAPALERALAACAADLVEARVVLCACDPLLYTRKRAGITPAFAARRAAEWREAHEALRAVALGSRRPVLVVAYEDLVTAPGATLRRVCAFLGTPWDDVLADWERAPSHALDAASERWGVAEPACDALQPAPAGRDGHGVETLAALDPSPQDALGIDVVRSVIHALAPTGLLECLGYRPALPRWVEPDEARREAMAVWVREDLGRAREAVLDGRAGEAIDLLRVLVEYFGERFDLLGLELTYEALAIVHLDLLNATGRGAEAVDHARALLEARPRNLEGRRLLAVALAAVGDVAATLAAFGAVVRASAESGETPEALAGQLAQVLTCIHPDEPLLQPFLDTLARHPALAADVEGDLEARLGAGTRTPETYAALGTVRGVRGDTTGAMRLLEDGLTWHSRSPLVQAAMFRLLARRHPDDARYDLRGRFCSQPFENVELLPDGAVHVCCAVWAPVPIGNVYRQRRWEDVWNSPDAEDMRRSVLDGTYRWCNKLSCALIQDGSLPTFAEAAAADPRWAQVIGEARVSVPFAPVTVNLAYDRSCNLACPSCRTHVIQSNEADRVRMEEMTERIVVPLLEGARRVMITGSGDPFGSRTFRRLLERLGTMDLPHLEYQIATNGQLLTPGMWDRIPMLKERARRVGVSIDAATPETYRVLRRPAEFERLMPNLRHIGRLVREGVVEEFALLFVVQRENYREMPDVVRLAHELGVTWITFQRLHNWDTFTREEYAARAVFHEDHPLHEDFLRVMQDPALRDPIVNLGMLKSFVRETSEAAAA